MDGQPLHTILLEGFALSRLNGYYRELPRKMAHRKVFESSAGYLLWYHLDTHRWLITKDAYDAGYFYAYCSDDARAPSDILQDWFLRRKMSDKHPDRQTRVRISQVKSGTGGSSPRQHRILEIGSVVAAKYRDGQWHNALILGLNRNGTYRVQYLDDGLEVKSQNQAMMKPEVEFKKGDRVQAQFRGQWHEVRILDGSRAHEDGSYTVQWLDGGEHHQLPKRISAGRLRCLRSSMNSLNVEGMMVRLESLALALEDKQVDITICKEGVDECRKAFAVMKEDSSRFEEQLEMKVEKCDYYSDDFTKRGTDNNRSVEMREKKLRDIDSKLKAQSKLMERTQSQIRQLQKQLDAYTKKVDDLRDVKKREEKFLEDVRRIRREVQDATTQVEAEKLSLSRTLEFQRDKMQKVEKVLAEVDEKVSTRLKTWSVTWPSWSPGDLKRWIQTVGDGHFSKYRSQIDKKIDELKLDGQRLGKVNDLVLKQFGLSDDDVEYLLEEICDLTGNRGAVDETSSKRKKSKRPAGSLPDAESPGDHLETQGDESDSDDHLCVICLNAPKTHICVPCGHKCCCQNCLDKFGKSCPICRKPTTMCIKIFD